MRGPLQSQRGARKEGSAKSDTSARSYFKQKVDPPALSVEWPRARLTQLARPFAAATFLPSLPAGSEKSKLPYLLKVVLGR